MFCKICGRMIAENALFCTFCGTSVADSTTDAKSASTSHTVESIQHEQVIHSIEASAPIVESVEPATEHTASSAQPDISTSVPMTQNSAATQSPSFEYSLELPTPQPKEQKYYTLGHIVMCLAAVGIMAIIAGVFAGLYFSVI